MFLVKLNQLFSGNSQRNSSYYKSNFVSLFLQPPLVVQRLTHNWLYKEENFFNVYNLQKSLTESFDSVI